MFPLSDDTVPDLMREGERFELKSRALFSFWMELIFNGAGDGLTLGELLI